MHRAEDQEPPEVTPFHRMPWTDFDALARGDIRVSTVRRLRRAERSRRLLLSRALLDEVTKSPELFGPLPSPEDAWDLLVQVEARAPAAFDRLLAHPYVGSWAGYTIRLLRMGITGVCPLWVHVGHLHAIAAAAAIHAGLNFHISVPVWDGHAILPTLGMANLPTTEPYSTAEVRGSGGRVEITHEDLHIALPRSLSADAPGWWSVRHVTTTGPHKLTVRLDDLDPYRGLREPVRPRRLTTADVEAWQSLIDQAWLPLNRHLPDLAAAFPAGLDSIVPLPAVRFGTASASTGEAFGSALVGRPADSATLAETLVHELHHIVLGGVLHLTRLYDDDPSERFYVPWRPDPRPLSGALQGVYAFFGVTAFWRAIARTGASGLARRARFEFALARSQTWRVLRTLRDDATLTPAGRRFLDGIASQLGPWQDEPLPDDLRHLADATTADHHGGFRMRHVRPDKQTIAALAEGWLTSLARPPIAIPPADPVPTPVRDGESSSARADLIRLSVTHDRRALTSMWQSVPGATLADLAYAAGRFHDAANGYRAELAKDPDRVPSWGLRSPLSAAVRRHEHSLVAPSGSVPYGGAIIVRSAEAPTPERLAAWIGQGVN